MLKAAFELWRPGDIAAYAAELLPDRCAAALVELYLGVLEEWAAEQLAVGVQPDLVEALRQGYSRYPLRERLAGGVAVWGGVGIGKSALALEFAYRHRDRYQVCWYVNAHTRTSIADGLEALANQLGVALSEDRDDGFHDLWDCLTRVGRWLLIFDDAARPAELAPYWPAGGGGDVVITSLNPDWGHHARPIQLQVLTPAETVTFCANGPDASIRTATRRWPGSWTACRWPASRPPPTSGRPG